jgi:preprotein translocase subunit SecA
LHFLRNGLLGHPKAMDLALLAAAHLAQLGRQNEALELLQKALNAEGPWVTMTANGASPEQFVTHYNNLLQQLGRRDLPSLHPRSLDAPSKISRNDPCPCGSGKKYKKCCLQ